MNRDYQAALDGTLKSDPNGAPVGTVTISNWLDVPVAVFWIDDQGLHSEEGPILGPQGGKFQWANVQAKNYFLITFPYTGGFVSVVSVVEGVLEYVIDYDSLVDPGAIGPFPVPNRQVIIPPDSPRVVVACGTVAGSETTPGYHAVVREQYWRRMADSYALAPAETRVVSTTSTSGKQETSSSLESIASTVGVSASAGWGPVSASLSASLSYNSTTFQQVTITEETTSYASDTVTNPSNTNPVMFLKWQLCDVITLFETDKQSEGIPIACVISGQSPVLIAGPYDPNNLPPREPRVPARRPRGGSPGRPERLPDAGAAPRLPRFVRPAPAAAE